MIRRLQAEQIQIVGSGLISIPDLMRRMKSNLAGNEESSMVKTIAVLFTTCLLYVYADICLTAGTDL